MSVKIIIDSASDFTENEAKKAGMIFLPMDIMFNEEERQDGVNLFAEEFYNKLEDCKNIPQTSLINEYRWGEAFVDATKDGSQVVAITLSSKLSGTYQAALNASKAFNGNVFVVDSLNAASGEGILVDYALMLLKEGKSAEEMYEILNEKKKNICVYAVIDTLKYLKKGGRISTATAIIGTTLSIKPIVGIIDGEVKMLGRAMGNKKGNLALNSMIEKEGGIDLYMPWNYIYSGNDKKNLEKFMICSEYLVVGKEKRARVLGSTIGTHIGSGAVGLAFFKK